VYARTQPVQWTSVQPSRVRLTEWTRDDPALAHATPSRAQRRFSARTGDDRAYTSVHRSPPHRKRAHAAVPLHCHQRLAEQRAGVVVQHHQRVSRREGEDVLCVRVRMCACVVQVDVTSSQNGVLAAPHSGGRCGLAPLPVRSALRRARRVRAHARTAHQQHTPLPHTGRRREWQCTGH
jgi:hypothetical protein